MTLYYKNNKGVILMDELTNQSAEPELQEEKKESTKPFSLRLGEESVQAFRSWCDEQGLNQADGFANLIKMLELQKTKELIPNRQKEVENFESLLASLTTAFMSSLELNENAETRIRQTVEQELQIKDQTISDNQKSFAEKNEKLKQLKEKADQTDALQSEVADLKKNIENYEKQITDKDSIVLMMTEKLSAAEEKLKVSEEQVKKFDEVLIRATLAEDKVKRLEEEKEHAVELAEEQKKAAVSAAVQQAKEDFQKEKDTLQREILNTEKAAHKKEQELQDEFRKLERQLGDLKLAKEKQQNEFTGKIEKLSNSYNALQKEFTDFKKLHSSDK